MKETGNAPPALFVAGRVYEMRALFNGDVEFRVSGGFAGPLRVSIKDPLWCKIKFRAHLLVVYEQVPGTENKVRLRDVKINPKPTDIFTLHGAMGR